MAEIKLAKENPEDECESVADSVNILLNTHIPDCQKALRESTGNLEKIADYCHDNFFRSVDKSEALELTSNYTKRALASISNQIYNCASNIVAMLNLLENQMDESVSNMSYVQMKIKFHEEKSERRDIGRLTKPKYLTTQPAIIFPDKPKTKQKVIYVKEAIDFTILDHIGVANKLHEARKESTAKWFPPVKSATLRPSKSSNLGSILPAQNDPSRTLTNSSQSQRTPAPTVRPPTPPLGGTLRFSSLSRGGGKDYHTLHAPPPVVAPPKLPSDYGTTNTSGANLEVKSLPKSSSSNSSSLLAPTNNATEPISASNSNTNLAEDMQKTDGENFAQYSNWIPSNFIEKVVAVYDYVADKDDELSFQENAVIYVIRKNDDGWWEGVLNGITGLFPGNYVEPCV